MQTRKTEKLPGLSRNSPRKLYQIQYMYVNYFPTIVVIQQNKLSKTYLDTRSHNFPVEGIWNPEIRQ